MSFATYAQIKANVQKELDLEDETFIQVSEMLAYCVEAVHQAEVIINQCCEDYFLDDVTLNLVSGQQAYDLPTDIFADKVRKVIYYNSANGDLYTMKRLRRSTSFQDLADADLNPSDFKQYLVTNDGTAGRKMKIFPTPNTSETATVRVWYLRNATVPTGDASVIDIPEFRSFIERYMIVRCMEKEGHPGLQFAAQMLLEEKQAMMTALKNRFPDDDDTLEMDGTAYEEHT